MITQNGEVAIAYYQTIPHVVKANGYAYAFVVKANICMAWIKEADVGVIMSLTKKCCGGQRTAAYRYANESDVRRWTNGGGS